MPSSDPRGKKAVSRILRGLFAADTRILDVGAGCGTYQKLLGDYFRHMDACEVHLPYIARYALADKYVHVFAEDIVRFSGFERYDLVIMGDVLEHLAVNDACAVLSKIRAANAAVMVAVPFLYKQGAYRGVEWERHLQPDLTDSVFRQRYGQFERLVVCRKRSGEETNAYYLWKR